MRKKITLILSMCLLGALLFAGCTRNTNPLSPSPTMTPRTSPLSSVAPMATSSASPTTSPMTSPTTSPLTSSVPGDGADTDALAIAKRIEAEVDKLSEIKHTAAYVDGGKAVIAVEFDQAYQGQMTDRIKQMILEQAKKVDSSLTDVAVTDDPDMMNDVKDMRTRADDGGVLNEIKTEFDKLFQRLNPTA